MVSEMKRTLLKLGSTRSETQMDADFFFIHTCTWRKCRCQRNQRASASQRVLYGR